MVQAILIIILTTTTTTDLTYTWSMAGDMKSEQYLKMPSTDKAIGSSRLTCSATCMMTYSDSHIMTYLQT